LPFLTDHEQFNFRKFTCQEGGKRSAPPLKIQTLTKLTFSASFPVVNTQPTLSLPWSIFQNHLATTNQDTQALLRSFLSNEVVLRDRSKLVRVNLERGRAALAPFPTCEFVEVECFTYRVSDYGN
jgi:hypothetical protein